MSTVYTVMGYGGLVLAIACLVFAIVLFINWNIPKILGDITGHSQRKAIERIQREGYEASASKQEAIRNVNETGKITIRKTDTEEIRMSQRESAAANEDITTGLNRETEGEDTTTVLNQAAESEDTTTVLQQASEDEDTTTVLHQAAEDEDTTTVLHQTSEDEDTTTVLHQAAEDEDITTVLHQTTEGEHATTVLPNSVIQLPPEKITDAGTVQQVLELIVTHTDKVVS